MEKAGDKAGARIAVAAAVIQWLTTILQGILANRPVVADIVSTVLLVLTVSGVYIKNIIKLIRRIRKGPGRHTGFFFTIYYDRRTKTATWFGARARYCHERRLTCGSPGTYSPPSY
jgi:hypothetical protein